MTDSTPSGVPVNPPQPPPIPRPWHVEVEGEARGPFTLGDLARMAAEGRLKPQTLVWKEGMAGWQAAQSVAEVARLVAVARPLPLPPRPMAPPARPRTPLMVILLIVGAVGLVVLAFVGILAAIAVPNFMEAQTRSKVARTRGDLRTMTIALETYYLDHNSYPAWSADRNRKAMGSSSQPDQPGFTIKRTQDDPLITLTTPVAYITQYFNDPFSPTRGATFSYWSPALAEKEPGAESGASAKKAGFILWSPGPDNTYDLSLNNIAQLYDPNQDGPSPGLINKAYDPSNGTTSRGDVWRIKQ